MKAQSLTDHLAENLVDEEYEPLKTYFPDEEVMYVDEADHDETPEFRHVPRIHNEIVDALATLALMLHHPDKTYVDPLHIQICDQHAYCNVVEEEPDGATSYLLVYGIEAVIPAEVEISSLRIVAEAEIDDDQWVKTRLEQLSLIDEKQLAAVCHSQLYQKRMARAYNKKAEAKGKFAPNWKGPFIVTKVFPNGALYLTDIEGKCVDMAINSDAVKRYYV
ncbi:uncharacterized protein [Nicotiana tomentosiformis]|uniref:uncharacterized protein n=1 Tax=Nicotiana tomentosiformis TaxID=4098 RepID=UPI00388CDE57